MAKNVWTTAGKVDVAVRVYQDGNVYVQAVIPIGVDEEKAIETTYLGNMEA